MANKYALNEATPANTADALEGPLRIREVKQAYNERIGRDHLIGGVTSPDVIAQGADSSDSGYHRRITIREETSDQATTANTRLNASSTGINDSTTAKMAEVWVEKSSATGNTTSIRFIGTEGAGNQRTVVTLDQTQTLTHKTLTAPTLTTVDINSGAIDGTAIGANSHSTGKFTTLEATGAVTLGDANADIISLKGTIKGETETYIGANQNFSGLVGEIRMYGGSAAPAGWLFCHGQTINDSDAPTGKYSDLIDVLVGAGPSSATLPDLRGKFPIGAGDDDDPNLTARTLHDVGGAETFTLAKANMPRHKHDVEFSQGDTTKHNHVAGITDDSTPGSEAYKWLLRRLDSGAWSTGAGDTSVGEPDLVASGEIQEVTHTVSHEGGDGSGTADEDGTAKSHMPPFYVVNFIIKY